jgi:hypothetical protein
MGATAVCETIAATLLTTKCSVRVNLGLFFLNKNSQKSIFFKYFKKNKITTAVALRYYVKLL